MNQDKRTPTSEGRNPNEARSLKPECLPQPTRSEAACACFDLQLSTLLRPSALGPRVALILLTSLFFAGHSFGAQTLSDDALAQIRFEQKPGAQVTRTLSFRDEEGKRVRLGDYLGNKPVVLVLGYYGCPMLCTLVLNGMLESAADLKWSIGREYEVVNVSINPAETPKLAVAKQRSYVKRYGRPGAAQGWHFLTGDEPAIRQLAHEVGFRYAYDPASKEYAHPSGLIFLTSQGKISGYLFGVTFAPKELYASLQAASAQQVSSPIQQFILLCFHYNPLTGKYSGLIMVVLRVLGALTVFGFLGLIVMLARRGRAAEAALATARDTKPEAQHAAPQTAHRSTA